MTSTEWWQRSVVYQIYPRSFCDSSGDGIGDLAGITSKLDHLEALGVDVIWLSPICRSPNDDNGYDISDYRAVTEEFGSMADFDRMLAGMHTRGLKLMMDLVVNHTSDEHALFRQARSSRDNPYHDYYIWRDPVDAREPNNWESTFSGSAWAWNEATGEYYLHLFSPRQPDLNWENPKVREEVHTLMRFWLDKGVDGFRMDAITMISKPWRADGSLPDAPVTRPGFLQPAFQLTANGARLLEFLQEMKRDVLSHYDCITVGEAPAATPQIAREITDRQHGALNMLFQFEHMDLDSVPGRGKWALRLLDLRDLKLSMSRWQDALADCGRNSLYLRNHDQPRSVSRFGDDGRYRVESAKMLATFLHGLQGTPYVYQGEELGMTNYPFAAIEDCRDIETLNMAREAVQQRGADPAHVMRVVRARGRDNARTPMQWTAGAQAGFTSGTPWLPVHPNHVSANAEQARSDSDSVFHHYRRLIELRRELPERLLVVCNFSAETLDFVPPESIQAERAQLLLGNWPEQRSDPSGVTRMRAYEALMYRLQ